MSKTIIGNIHIVSCDPQIGEIPNGRIVIEDGKIVSVEDAEVDSNVGTNGEVDVDTATTATAAPTAATGGGASEQETHYIDGEGCLAFPGFIDAHCHLGLLNDHLRWEGSDANEVTDPVTPELRAIDSIFHDDINMEEAIQGGVTCVMTGPGSANVIGGEFCVIKPYGRSVDEMVVKAPAAMKAALGENPKSVYGQSSKSPHTRMASASILRSALLKAQHYMETQERAAATGKDEPALDLKSEALIPVLQRELVLKIHCHRADDILTAVRIANEFGLRYTLDHCTEGYLIADILEEEYADRALDGHGTLEGIICGPLISNRSKPELTRKWDGLPAVLMDTGIPVAIATDHPVIPIQYGPVQAALMMRHELTREEALASITTNAAKILGLEDRLGRLAPGLDADLVLWNEDPFSTSATTSRVFIDGNLVYEN